MGRKRQRKKTTRRKRMTLEQIFLKRSSSIYNGQKKRARDAGVLLPYTLDDLRGLIRRAIENKRCTYCCRELTPKNISVDHRIPLCRNGSFSFSNLFACDLTCNLAKGPLTEIEWREICHVTNTWTNDSRTNLFSRLKAGARVVRGYHMSLKQELENNEEPEQLQQ